MAPLLRLARMLVRTRSKKPPLQDICHQVICLFSRLDRVVHDLCRWCTAICCGFLKYHILYANRNNCHYRVGVIYSDSNDCHEGQTPAALLTVAKFSLSVLRVFRILGDGNLGERSGQKTTHFSPKCIYTSLISWILDGCCITSCNRNVLFPVLYT